MHWARLSSVVMGPSMLGKGVETSPAAAQAQPRLVCTQTMPRLPGVCLQQVKLFQRSHGRQT